MTFEAARKIADAILYEGYVLYPYRASAGKNQIRWQFGVVAPREYSEATGTDPWFMQTECLLEASDPIVALDLRLRCLQVQERRIATAAGLDVDRLEVDGKLLIPWEEGFEQQIDRSLTNLFELGREEQTIPIEIAGSLMREEMSGASGYVEAYVIRERWPISAELHVSAREVDGLWKLRARVENHTPWPGRERAAAMRRSLVGAHLLFAVRGGAFISLLEPPPHAADAAASCENVRTWPILVGEKGQRDVVLSSPIILYDHPQIAPESPGDLYDSTEIDEILTLRIMTLTDEEKREASATDVRAAKIVERSDGIPPEQLARLHGAVRAVPDPFDPFATENGKEAGDDEVMVGGVLVAKGATVRLRPKRKSDSMDMFLEGELARVEGVYRDLDGATYVAVTVSADPGQDLHAWYGRYFYFYPDEIEPQ